MKWFFFLVAYLAGTCAAVQVGVNNSLRAALGSSISTALVSFGVGSVVLLGFVLLARIPMPLAQAAASGPFWIWLGGVLGATFVAASILVAANIGAAGAMVWIIAAQLITSMLLDHYGFFGFHVREINPVRVVGALLLLAGAFMVSRY